MAVRKPGEIPLGDHIARVAAELFYREGIHVVGVDRIAAEADVTKRTLYRYYDSKDALIAAALRRGRLIRFPREGTPAEQVAGAFRAMIAFLRESAYRGCPYINAAAELADPRHPARAVLAEIVARRRRWFRDRAAEAGATDPELLSEQLDVLFDGALANAAKRGDAAPARAALAAAESLFAAAARSDVRRRRRAQRGRTIAAR